VVNLRFLLAISFNQKICSFFKMIGFELKTLLHWSSYFFEISLMLGFISSSSRFQGQNHDSLLFINSMILFLVPNLAGLHWGFFLQQIKNICNASTLDDMHASLPDLKYRPPSSMFHHHRVPLFVIQSFLYSFNVLAHSCASLPLRCKFSAYRVLSVMITVLVVYQAWVCPQVWCCLIHHEWA
jgi:hypothetical protein